MPKVSQLLKELCVSFFYTVPHLRSPELKALGKAKNNAFKGPSDYLFHIPSLQGEHQPYSEFTNKTLSHKMTKNFNLNIRKRKTLSWSQMLETETRIIKLVQNSSQASKLSPKEFSRKSEKARVHHTPMGVTWCQALRSFGIN